MEKIGEGLQYTVYDAGSRVKKVPKSRSDMIEYLRKFHDSEEKIKQGVQDAIDRRKRIETKFKGESYPFLPRFSINGHVIYQEKLDVTGDVLDEADSLEVKKKVIDDYIQLLKQCWRYGVHDMSYNFTLNTGYNQDNVIVQLDLGDLIFSKKRIKKEVENQKWLDDSVSYTKYMSQEIKPYYKRRMDEEITSEKLDKLWKKERE